ncbi:MAG: hypothetical protein NVS4B3_03560 [Gemmatimonadaceae bacterium]
MSSKMPSQLNAWLPAVLFLAGSAVFLGAGRLHPHINASLGEVGTDQFFRAFAAEMLNTPNWGAMHLGILLGPIFWALAAAGTARLLPWGTALSDVGRNALLLASALWSVAFVLDGFVGPWLAHAVLPAGIPSEAVAIRAFGASQLSVARLGMISVVLIGVAMFAFGTALLIDARVRSWRAAVGALGVAAGIWPAVAALRGEFSPGPFTSPYWTLTALSMGLWFILLATVLPQLTKHDRTVTGALDELGRSIGVGLEASLTSGQHA